MGTVTVRKADDDTWEIEWENGETATASTAEEAAATIGVPLTNFNSEFETAEGNDDDTVEFEVDGEGEEDKDG